MMYRLFCIHTNVDSLKSSVKNVNLLLIGLCFKLQMVANNSLDGWILVHVPI